MRRNRREAIPHEKAAKSAARAAGSTLSAFSADLGAKPQLVVVNKIDALQDEDHLSALQAHCDASDTPLHRISAVSGVGVKELLEATWALVERVGAGPRSSLGRAVARLRAALEEAGEG